MIAGQLRVISLVGLAGCCGGVTPSPLAYPAAPRSSVVERHAGIDVPDPYRWLEDMASPATRAWLAAENAVTVPLLAALPTRADFRAQLTVLARHDINYSPLHRGEHYFWVHADGVHDQPTVEMASTVDGPATVLLDANQLAAGGRVTFSGWTTDRAGTVLAYGTAEGGGDWEVWHFRDVATGTDRPDELTGIKYYAPVLVDDGVYYSRFAVPEKGKELTETDHDCALYFHVFGTPVASDKVVYARPDHPTWQFSPERTTDGSQLVIRIGDGQVGDTNLEQLAVLPLGPPGAAVTMLHETFDASYDLVGGVGSLLYFQTNDHAPNKRIVAVDLHAPTSWQTIVPEGKRAIDSATIAGRVLLVTELRDAYHALVAYDLQGVRQREIALPAPGSVVVGRTPTDETHAPLYFTGFATPGSGYRLDLATGDVTPWRRAAGARELDAIETKQVFIASADGTKIPMFLAGKRGFAERGPHAVLLTAYGFGGISSTPYYSSLYAAWMERGGVLALVNVRGGGEYGEAWHQAATRAHEQVKLDDFNAAAAWLAANGISTHARVGAIGTSGGGMLVAAAVLQHPELYGAAFPIAGVDDLMRFQLFGQGAGWQADLGHPDDPVEGRALFAISPVHNTHAGTRYPATLVITSDHDVRVAPLHSYKLAAALQAAQGGAAPILLHVEADSGHGGGSQVSQEIEQDADILAFAAKYLGL